MIYSVALDFDGVVHKYSKGYQDGSIYDVPVDGAIEAIKRFQVHYAVYIHTTRNTHDVAKWLNDHGVLAVADDGTYAEVFWTRKDLVLVTNRKIPAIVYIDDRGLRFTGNWDRTMQEFAELQRAYRARIKG